MDYTISKIFYRIVNCLEQYGILHPYWVEYWDSQSEHIVLEDNVPHVEGK